MRKITIYLLAMVVPTLFILAAAELVLRWYDDARIAKMMSDQNRKISAQKIHKGSEDPEIMYELVANAETAYLDVPVKINSAGYRDDEFPSSPGNGTRNIVVLGDSVAWGWGVPMEKSFPQLLEAELNENVRPGDPSYVIYNLAVDGYSTSQEIRVLETRGLNFKPDLVILNYVLNDPDCIDGGLGRYYKKRIMIADYASRAYERAREYIFGFSSLEYHQRVHASFADDITHNFQKLGKLSKQYNVPVLVVITPVFRYKPGEPYPWQNIHKLIKQQSKSVGLGVYDLYSEFKDLNPEPYSLDLWHPSVQGHKIIADSLLSYLKTYDWK